MLYPLNVVILRFNDGTGYRVQYLVWKPKYSNFKSWARWSPKLAQKRGFPEVGFGGLFWGFYDPYTIKFTVCYTSGQIHPLL